MEGGFISNASAKSSDAENQQDKEEKLIRQLNVIFSHDIDNDITLFYLLRLENINNLSIFPVLSLQFWAYFKDLINKENSDNQKKVEQDFNFVGDILIHSNLGKEAVNFAIEDKNCLKTLCSIVNYRGLIKSYRENESSLLIPILNH